MATPLSMIDLFGPDVPNAAEGSPVERFWKIEMRVPDRKSVV